MFTFPVPIYFNINILTKIIKYINLPTEGKFISLPSYHYPNLVADILRYIFILVKEIRSLFHFTHNKVIENNSWSKRKI